MKRRDLIKLGLASTTAMLASPLFAAIDKPKKPLSILILGGTGFMGPTQVHYALSRGHKVTLLNRGRKDVEWPAGVEELVGDRNKGELDALKGRQWDVCIDNPTTLPFWVRDAGKALAGNVGHYLFVSTISVYAGNATADADESAALLNYGGADAMAETQETLKANMALYGQLKAASEREAEKQFPGITTIVRPGLIVGPGDPTDRYTYWPVRLARGGDVVAPGDGSDPAQVIDARDLAEWIVRLAEQHEIGTFNATGPARPMTMKSMLADIGKAVDSKAKLHWLPTEFLAEQKVAPWRDMPVWLPGQGDTAGFAERSIAKALAAGLTFRPQATTAADTLAWFRQQPAERQAKLGAGLDAEREAAVLTAWRLRNKS